MSGKDCVKVWLLQVSRGAGVYVLAVDVRLYVLSTFHQTGILG